MRTGINIGIVVVHQIHKQEFQLKPLYCSLQVSAWHKNPLVRGAYSFYSMAMDTELIDPVVILEPEYSGRLLFAGEATNLVKHSTVHGAIETGWREARRIIKN